MSGFRIYNTDAEQATNHTLYAVNSNPDLLPRQGEVVFTSSDTLNESRDLPITRNTVITAKDISVFFDENLPRNSAQQFTFGVRRTPGRFVSTMGSIDPALRYSDDGITWIGASGAVPSQAQAVAWNGTMWVAGGTDAANYLVYSQDGITWQSCQGDLNRTNTIHWNGELWVAGTDGLGSAPSVIYSTDGITWNQGDAPLTFVTVEKVTYNGDLWVAVGTHGAGSRILYSQDGMNWSTALGANLTDTGRDVIWNGQGWIAIGSDGAIVISPDGITWSAPTTPSPLPGGRTLGWNNTLVVAGGSGGGVVAYSTDNGDNWTAGTGYTGADARSIIWNGRRWVATSALGGPPNIFYSDDGITWTLGTQLTPPVGPLSGLAWSGSRWVATGGITGPSAAPLYSDDGITWVTGTAPAQGAPTEVVWNSALSNTITIPSDSDPDQNVRVNITSPDGKVLLSKGDILSFSTEGVYPVPGNFTQYTVSVNI